MTIPQSRKAFVSVVEMTEMLSLSKSRFYALIEAGVFPRPVRIASCKRPVFDLDLQQRCLEIRRTGIAENNQPVLFNRKRRKATSPKPRQNHQPVTKEQAELVEAMKSLGLTVKPEEVQAAMQDLYPNGRDGIDDGEVLRRLFLHLRGKR